MTREHWWWIGLLVLVVYLFALIVFVQKCDGGELTREVCDSLWRVGKIDSLVEKSPFSGRVTTQQDSTANWILGVNRALSAIADTMYFEATWVETVRSHLAIDDTTGTTIVRSYIYVDIPDTITRIIRLVRVERP